MARYWLCTVSEENWRVIKQRLIWGVSEKFRKRIENISAGDIIVFYVAPASIGGVFEVTSQVFKDDTRIFASNEVYPYRVKLKPLLVPAKRVNFKPLITKLSFIRNKNRWAAYIRLPLREISKEDYEIIIKHVKEGEKCSQTE